MNEELNEEQNDEFDIEYRARLKRANVMPIFAGVIMSLLSVVAVIGIFATLISKAFGSLSGFGDSSASFDFGDSTVAEDEDDWSWDEEDEEEWSWDDDETVVEDVVASDTADWSSSDVEDAYDYDLNSDASFDSSFVDGGEDATIGISEYSWDDFQAQFNTYINEVSGLLEGNGGVYEYPDELISIDETGFDVLEGAYEFAFADMVDWQDYFDEDKKTLLSDPDNVAYGFMTYWIGSDEANPVSTYIDVVIFKSTGTNDYISHEFPGPGSQSE